ncbi:MAG: tetratricopeptide repeat protein, partial [Terriglobia bacterium]
EPTEERRVLGSKRENLEGETAQNASQLPGAPLSDRAATLALALVLAVVFLAYLDTLWFQFVHDDRFQILANTWLRSWKYLPRYFTADVWAFEHPVFRGTFYRPIFLLWFRLQYLVFGLKPWGWHLCTVLCHVGVTLLVYYTAARLLEDRLAALFATLIFGLHPTHAEAVAWVSGVTEPLFAIFLFASYLCYLKKRAEPARARTYLAASLALYALAALSKETAVILPFIIFACELLWSEPTAPSRWRAWGGRSLDAFPVGARHGVPLRWWGAWVGRSLDAFRAVVPYLALFAIYMVARVISLQGFQNPREEHSFLSMFLTWPSVLWFYLQHLVWPTHLSPFYSREYYSHLDVRNVLLPAIPVLITGAGLWFWGKRSPKAAVATIWLVVPILPVLNLRAFVEGHLVHDRYLYLPSFGFAMLAALGMRHLRLGPGRLLGQPAVQLGLAGIIGLAMGLEVVQATACYANETTFFTYVTSMSPEGHSSNMDLAGLLGNQGHLDEAIRIYTEIWPTQPDNWDVNYNLGYAYYLTRRLPEADRYLSRAVQIDASRPDAFFYLGLTKLKMGDVNAAAANVQRAVTIRPDADHYHFALGVILKLQGNLPGALSEFHQEMDLDPANTSAREQAEEIEAAQAAGQKGTPPGYMPPPGTQPPTNFSPETR